MRTPAVARVLAWGAFLEARAFLVRCLDDGGDSPEAILATCNFADADHVRAVIENVKTGATFEAPIPRGINAV